jgi:hypothetical protein
MWDINRALLTSLALAACVLFPTRSPAAEPTRAAPIYSLPEDGTWVEYDWTGLGPDGKELKGVLRVSSVGTKTTAGVTSRWVEVRKEYREGDETKREFRKFLVSVKAFADAPTLSDHVTAVIGQDNNDTPAALSPARARTFVTLGLTAEDATLEQVRAREPVEVPLGKYQARHVRARSRADDRKLGYQGWLTGEVPFGCARFEVFEKSASGPPRRIFTAVAARTGRGARPEVDESKAR